MQPITVYKRDHHGCAIIHYTGTLVESGATWVCIQAHAGFEHADVGAFRICRGDLMTEWFYADRYYNIFRIQHGETGQLKGWYCNITRPAEITAESIASDDLALDLVVSRDGVISLRDEAEFDSLNLSPQEQQAAWNAVSMLRGLVERRQPPFEDLHP